MYVITIRMRALPSHVDELTRLSLATVEPSRAEPGCVVFELLQSTSDPDEILFYEAYVDRAAFERHLEAKHVRAWQALALPLVDPASIQMPAHRRVTRPR